MANSFFEHPILNSPYECPQRHWELDEHGQPTQRICELVDKRRYQVAYAVLPMDILGIYVLLPA
jgi:hypothetical protein